MCPSETAVLAANDAFYAAFAAGDLEAMEAIWARHAPVACVHPGWQALRGRQEVMESWRLILDGAGAPGITPLRPSIHLLGDTAFVICVERLGGGALVATNVFIREDGAWRLVHHQAGPVPPKAAQGDDEGTGFLN